jgi:hypothetical protein
MEDMIRSMYVDFGFPTSTANLILRKITALKIAHLPSTDEEILPRYIGSYTYSPILVSVIAISIHGREQGRAGPL